MCATPRPKHSLTDLPLTLVCNILLRSCKCDKLLWRVENLSATGCIAQTGKTAWHDLSMLLSPLFLSSFLSVLFFPVLSAYPAVSVFAY